MCIGCTQPPPPFATVHTSPEALRFGRASGVRGLNSRLLITHWVSPPAVPLRCNVNDRCGKLVLLFGRIGMGRRLLGTTLTSASGGAPPMTIFMIGTL